MSSTLAGGTASSGCGLNPAQDHYSVGAIPSSKEHLMRMTSTLLFTALAFTVACGSAPEPVAAASLQVAVG